MTDTTPAPAKFSFIKLIVHDLDRVEHFYAQAFGMKRVGEFETPTIEEAILRGASGFSLVLYRWKDGRSLDLGTAYGPIGFAVPDVDTAYHHALAHGAGDSRAPANYGTTRAAFITDPEGHEVELVGGVPG
jgi:lactoylglutathione lyase